MPQIDNLIQDCNLAAEKQARSSCDCRYRFDLVAKAAIHIKHNYEELAGRLDAIRRKHPGIFQEIMDEERNNHG